MGGDEGRGDDGGAHGSERTSEAGATDGTGTPGTPPDTAFRVGVTGHVNLTPATVRLVARQVRNQLRLLRESLGHEGAVVGVSCLAPGADSVFACAVLDVGGALEVLVPSRDYRDGKLGPADAEHFDALLRRAWTVWTGPYASAGPRAYAAANDELLRRIGHLFAIWDGDEGGGLGSTADTVRAARQRSIPVTVVWPDGAQRSTPEKAGPGPAGLVARGDHLR